MKLTIYDLKDIVAAVEKVQESQLDIRELRVCGHIVELLRVDDQKEGSTYYITRISSADIIKSVTNYR